MVAFELNAICSLRSFYGLAKQDGTWFFCIVDFRSVNLTSEEFFVRVTSSAKAFFEVVDVLMERFSGGGSSQKSKGFARGCQGFLGCEISRLCKQLSPES